MLDFSAIPPSSVLGRMLRLPLRLISPAATFRVLQGPLRGQRWIVGADVHGYWLGSYERQKCELFAKLVQPGDVVYDVGANVGYYSLIAAHLAGPAGRVYAFEPVPRNVAYLSRHLEMNAVANTTILEVAVAARAGMARFDASGEPSMGSLNPSGTLHVKTVVLDDLLAMSAVEPPTLVKIDVEGAELSVLQGATHILRRYRPLILLATHGRAVHDACVTLLENERYELIAIDTQRVASASELLARPMPVTT